jgi:hypothetical protein
MTTFATSHNILIYPLVSKLSLTRVSASRPLHIVAPLLVYLTSPEGTRPNERTREAGQLFVSAACAAHLQPSSAFTCSVPFQAGLPSHICSPGISSPPPSVPVSVCSKSCRCASQRDMQCVDDLLAVVSRSHERDGRRACCR